MAHSVRHKWLAATRPTCAACRSALWPGSKAWPCPGRSGQDAPKDDDENEIGNLKTDKDGLSTEEESIEEEGETDFFSPVHALQHA